MQSSFPVIYIDSSLLGGTSSFLRLYLKFLLNEEAWPLLAFPNYELVASISSGKIRSTNKGGSHRCWSIGLTIASSFPEHVLSFTFFLFYCLISFT